MPHKIDALATFEKFERLIATSFVSTGKKQINASRNLSRGAKHMAEFLCDTYVNKHTGECWPKTETLINDLKISERSVLRHLKELQVEGWLRKVSMN